MGRDNYRSFDEKSMKLMRVNLARKTAECVCGRRCGRHSFGKRWVRDVGVTCPVLLEITYSKHYCRACGRYFNIPMEHVAKAGSNFTNKVRLAVLEAHKKTKDFKRLREHMRERWFVHVSDGTLRDWTIV